MHDRRRSGGLALLATTMVLGACASSPTSPEATAPAGVAGARGTCADSAAPVVSLGVGDVRDLAGSRWCAPGGDGGAEYVLVAFNAGAERAAVELRASGAAPAGALHAAALVAPTTPAGAVADGGVTEHAVRRLPLPRLAPAARRRGGRAARAALVAPAPGDLVSLNVQAGSACERPVARAGRVAAVSRHALVVADTLDTGLSAGDYAAIGALFDTLVHPAVADVFGAPTDVDGNGRVIVFYTSAINALTPAGAGAYVGGLFLPRDLFPADGCAGSNAAEVIYMMTADEAGAVNGNVRPRELVLRVAATQLAHELQHVVNAGRRLYVTPGAALIEEEWLDEALSHAAEELVFYRAAGEAPRRDLSLARLGASPAALDALYRHQAGNLGRLAAHLADPAATTPFAGAERLGDRGAAWQFVRYAADRWTNAGGGDEREFWARLASSPRTGLDNLRDVLGGDPMTLAADWALAEVADDLTAAGAGGRWAQPSWDYRDVVAPFAGGRFPLRVSELALAPATATLGTGGALYGRRTVAAGDAAAFAATAPAGVVLRLLRVR